MSATIIVIVLLILPFQSDKLNIPIELSVYDEALGDQTNHSHVFQKFFDLFSQNQKIRQDALSFIDKNWEIEYIPLTLDVLSLTNDPWIRKDIFELLTQKTGQTFGTDLHSWLVWLWSQEEKIYSDYGDFKALLYSNIDEKFGTYFYDRTQQTNIRLDEVRWGGVVQDGIPPLRNPAMISAKEAQYLKDDHIVFGLEVNGDARAYPKRILAWHEMFTDEIGGIPVAGVYCTLCGTLIVYETTVEGIEFELGTSGFLYRSNKLMYDQGTQSLWNTILGAPVIGPLINMNIQLKPRSVVTTSWGEWKRRHPKTSVLSLSTGYNRNYSEGAAYKEYFATDQLMFPVPQIDDRLNNKDEVFIIRPDNFREDPLAISTRFLRKNPIYHDQIGETRIVVLTDKSGANRSYESMDIVFQSYDQESSLTDKNGIEWKLSESSLVSTNGIQLLRLADHRAFWFGWYSMFPNTRLVK